MNKKQIGIDDKVYGMNFPSVVRVNRLQTLLGIDIFLDSERLSASPNLYTKNLDTDEKTFQALQIILGDDATQELAESLSPLDMTRLFTVFFSAILELRTKLNGELKPLQHTEPIIKKFDHPEDTHSTS